MPQAKDGKNPGAADAPKPGSPGSGPAGRTRLVAIAVAAVVAAAVILILNFGRTDGQDLTVTDRVSAQAAPAAPGAPAAVPAQAPAAPPAASQEAQAPITEGDDYKRLAKVLTLTPETPEKPLELVYVFWYGCGTCRRIDAAMDQYVRTLSMDVRAVRIPAMYEPNELWMNHARFYYALNSIGKEAGLHSKIFEAVQSGPADSSGHALAGLANFDDMARFAEENGISRADFEAAWNSPETATRYQKGLDFINNLDLDSVPAMGINGRFAFPISRGGIARFLETAQKLLADERDRLAREAG
ncbi:MAG: thiol:disulfide interchange protein DsbA/DsbL [Deltaproteobacteria bacterium]|nr:thiol:disulfide interchange protein DsbA/DsbL [Deltaproteobacteria bacterium]